MMKRLFMLMALALCLLALAFDAPPADAATINVPCTANQLIAAIETANSNGPNPDTIELAADCTYALSSPYVIPGNYASWYGPSGLPAIASEITVVGNGATIMRSDTAGLPFRLLFVGANPIDPDTRDYATPGAGDLTLRDLTLRGGLGQGGDAIVGGGGGAGMGGAIFNQGEVTLERVTITNSTARGGNGGSGSGVGPGGGIGSNAGSTADSSGGGFGVGYFALGGGSGGTNSGGGGFRAYEDGQSGVDPLTGGNGGGPATGLGGRGGAAAGTPGMGGNGAGGGTPTSENGGNGGDFGRGGVEGAGGGVGGGGATLDNGSGGGFGGGGGGANGVGGNGGFGGGGGNGSSIGIGGFGGGNGALISSSGGGGGGAGMGGAIFNHQGTLTLLNSTLSGNTAVGGQAGSAADAGRGLGGAIFNLNGAVRIDYSTIAYNTADDGGALYNLGYLAEDTGDPDGHTYSAHVVAAGSIITPAVVSAAPAMVSGGLQNTVDDPGDTTIDPTASNLIGAATEIGDGAVLRGPNTLEGDPVLGLLAENGGLTPTHALSPASPAIDTAQGTCPSTDQRGEARPSGFACDIGAFELNYFTPPKDVTSPVLSLPEDITQEATSSDGATVNWSATATDDVDASITVDCQSASGLTSGDTFPLGTTTITCSATDAAGNKAEGSFNVTVVAARDTTAPTVFSTTPGNNGTMTNKASNVMATFSEDVKNVNATTFKLEQVKVSRKGVETTSPVAATVTPASGTVAQGASATLNPKKDLQKASTYRATLTSGVTDTAGNALSAPYSWTFQVSR
jgi:hypothetical protein